MVISIHTTDFQNLINTPARITASFASVLDLIITNNKGAIQAGRIATNISDHVLVCLCKNKQTKKTRMRSNPLYEIRLQLISKEKHDMFRYRICCVTWVSVYNTGTVDDAYNTFLSFSLQFVMTVFANVKITPCKKARRSWMTRVSFELSRGKNYYQHLIKSVSHC